jgi:hypothetical protein
MMTNPTDARPFLEAEVESLEAFGVLAVVPSGQPLHIVEVARSGEGALEVRVPGRPRAVPALEPKVRGALLERGFGSEDPADQTEPWVRAVGSKEEAVERLQRVFVDVFGEKPDVDLDIGHGSYKLEYEAKRKLGIARRRIEGIVTEILGHRADQDKDKDYLLPIGEVRVVVAPRAAPDGQVVVRIFAITNVGINVTPDLGLFLARLNFGLMFGRFALDVVHRSIWVDETLLGEEFRDEELRLAIRVVSSTADEWDNRLKEMFGGATYQEVLNGQANEAPPPNKPGEGVGQYL